MSVTRIKKNEFKWSIFLKTAENFTVINAENTEGYFCFMKTRYCDHRDLSSLKHKEFLNCFFYLNSNKTAHIFCHYTHFEAKRPEICWTNYPVCKAHRDIPGAKRRGGYYREPPPAPAGGGSTEESALLENRIYTISLSLANFVGFYSV